MKKAKVFSILLSVLLLIVAISSFAWFYSNNVVNLQPKKDLTVSVGADLKVALDGENPEYGNKIEMELTNTSLRDCSGDGLTFFDFGTLDDSDKPVLETYQEVATDERSKYVIEINLLLQTANAIDVYLGKDSFVHPDEEIKENPVYNNVNSNYIAGCARVAFVEVDENGDEHLKYVWAPNSKYQVMKTNNVYSVTKNGTRETSYGYYAYNQARDGVQLYTYTTEDYLNGKFTIAEGSELCSSTAIQSSLPVVSFGEEGVLQTKRLKVRIWFEGTDREAHAAMNKGEVYYNLSFMGISKLSPLQEDLDKLNTIQCAHKSGDLYGLYYGNTTTEPTGVLYSFNGLDWMSLGSGSSFTATTEEQKLYLKLAETVRYKPSTQYVTVTIPAKTA